MDPEEVIRLLHLLHNVGSGETSVDDLREAAIRSTLDEVMAVEKLLDIQIEPGSYMLGSVLNEFGIGALVSESFRDQARDSLAVLRDAYIQKTAG